MSVYQNLSLEQVGQSIANNTSKVRIKWTSQQTGTSYNDAPGDKAYYYITINGGTETEHTVAFTLPQNTTKTILDTTLTVSHKADGTGSIKVRTWMDTEISAGVIEQTKTLTLDTIPRASAVSAPSTGTLGTALKITIDRKSANFNDKLYYKIGSNSAVQIAEYDGTAGTYSWTPPVSLATNAPNSTKLAVTLIATTYNGTAYVGRSECTVTLAIPSSVVPSLKVAVSDPTNVKTNYGGYFVQLRSKIAVTITGTGVRGSTIKSYSIKVGSAAGSGNIYAESASSGTTDFLPVSGTVWVTCTVTDSRGRTASKSIDYKVVPYRTPTIVAISATRCTQDGTVDRMGAYAKVTFSATITKLYGNNTAAYQVQYRKYGTTDAWTVVAAPASGDYEPKNIYIVFPADKSKRYTVRVVATDAFVSNYSSLRDIPAAFVLLDFAKRLLSVGVGRLCDKSNALQIGIDTYFDKLVDARKLYMRGDDQEKTIFFQTSEEAGNKHNVQIFGGNGASPTAIGLYDARNGYSVAKYNDAEKKLYLGLGNVAVVIGQPSLTDAQKEQMKALMDAYVATATSPNIWKYVGEHTRNDYAASSTTKADGLNKSNCETFVQNIWMGRDVNDYKESTYTSSVTKAFNWGYFFEFLYRGAYNLKYAADASNPSRVLWPGFTRVNSGDYIGSYSYNSHYDSSVSDPQKQSPESWMVAGDMAYELMLMGCEISAHEMQVGDMLFYRAASLQDGVADAFQRQQFHNISHVGLCYGFDTAGRPIICECTNGWNDPIIITGLGDDCEALLPTGHSDNRWVWTRTRAAALGRRLVMVARHPAAFGLGSNVPSRITTI